MTFYERSFVLFMLSLTFCWAGRCLSAQPAQLVFRQYNTDQGLPSSETYTILEDRSGYLWIGTDNGVARFDGYEFEVFDADDGLEDMVIFGIVEADDGKIWISTYSGGIYFFEHGAFHPFEHNNVLEHIKKSKHLGVLVDVTPEKKFIVSFKNAGLLKLDSSGTTEWLVTPESNDVYLYEREGKKNQNTTSPPHAFYQSPVSRVRDSTRVSIIDPYASKRIGTIQSEKLHAHRSYFSGAFVDEGGRKEYLISCVRKLYALDAAGKTKHEFVISSNGLNYFMPGFYPDTYWGLLDRGGGLLGIDFRKGGASPRFSQQLVGRSLSSAIIDKNGGFWVTSLDAGIFYCPYPKQLLYKREDATDNNKAIAIAATGPEDFYVGYSNGGFFHYSKNDEQLARVEDAELTAPGRLFDLHYDPISSLMLTPYYAFEHPVAEGRKLRAADVKKFYFKSGRPLLIKNFNEPGGGNTRKIFGSNISGLVVLNMDLEEIIEEQSEFGVLPGNAHVYGLHPDGRPLVGTLSGLMEQREDGSLVPNNLGIPELSKRVVAIKGLGNDDLLFGTRGDGLIYVSPDTTYFIRESNGLASDMIRHVHIDDSGVIWVSSLNGLSKLYIPEDGGKYQLRTFRPEHGLPTNEVYQTDTYGEEVWLATSAGVVRFNEPPLISQSSRPVIRTVMLNGKPLPDTNVYDLPSGPQDVSISFGTINFVLGDEVLYRYRLNDAANWQYSNERTVNYPNLSPGTYRFEVQSRNQDGIWSPGVIRDIRVATPWYETTWAILGAILLAGAGLSAYFLFREQRRRREQDLLFQITKLEHAALHAQMNPHFVFNALNSIQNFVLENDAKQAATYLSRFARVIRQTLRSSVDGRHHLGEEQMMLETYLGLEKLRFKEGFTYTLEIDPSLPKENIVLPPLLIQPFVENAIIHGLQGKKEGGKISVHFTGTAEQLMVVIEDNGKGYEPAEADKAESLGMDITRRRLKMLGRGRSHTSGMEIESLLSEDGSLQGTRVTLFICPLTTTAPASAPLETMRKPDR
ncbi:hypothetical protein FUA23_15940 [Neolewinella aurantiaca]|uniref:Two component regulator with propeller domain n=1 Tax=Neolewinella aurantiaca TaxID=2602767 RepID=A0A5C7FEZ0_9BACT|nr:sensor histidine kinase [Neolewinella aurantiaca]TXF88131.1 hypothetical protein FUA23_15940 [Neolewinella aurantiaca]